MAKRTILEAVTMVLDDIPRSAANVHARIVEASLFEFKAKDPIAMVRAAIRGHLKSHGQPGQPAARIRMVERDRYVLP